MSDTEQVPATARERPWLLHLICCGRDDGMWPCATWDEADEIRRSYVEAEGHERTAIITRLEGES